MDLNERRFKLNKDIPIPLYYQVKRIVLNELANGNLQQGDKLPAEIEFCESLEVSRPTVRMALNELVAEGILVRNKRSGTFVAEPKMQLNLSSGSETLKSFVEGAGHGCEIAILDLCVVDKIDEINQRLQLDADEQLIYLKRMWRVNGVPFMYSAAYLSHRKYHGIMDKDFSARSLFENLNLCYGLDVAGRTVHVESVLASKNDIGLLEIDRTRAALLYAAELIEDRHAAPVCWSISRYRGDKFYLSYKTDS